MPHIQGGTRTDRALELAAEDFFGWEDSGDRPDKPNVLIVLTDGNTNEGSKPFNQVIPPLDVSNCWQTIIASFIVFFFLQAAPQVEIPKTFMSGTGHFERDFTHSTQTFQVIIINLFNTVERTLTSHCKMHQRVKPKHLLVDPNF